MNVQDYKLFKGFMIVYSKLWIVRFLVGLFSWSIHNVYLQCQRRNYIISLKIYLRIDSVFNVLTMMYDVGLLIRQEPLLDALT